MASTSTAASKSPASNHSHGSTKPVPALYNKWMNETLKKGVDGIIAEFDTLHAIKPDDVTATAFAANPGRNRYEKIKCLDATRIVLRSADQDYIHANSVRGSQASNKFICTQGPLSNTVVDFWRMLWQEKCSAVLMLCEVMEEKKEKCAQYWPIAVGETKMFGEFKVTNVEVNTNQLNKKDATTTVTVSRLELTNTKEPTVRAKSSVSHMQWRGWPDHGVPTDSKSAIVLRARAMGHGQPMVVHCSAGIGRTGTFCALDLLMKQLETTPATVSVMYMTKTELQMLDVPATVKALRAQRLCSVQTVGQYVFIYRVIIDFIAMLYGMNTADPQLMEFWAKHVALQKKAQ